MLTFACPCCLVLIIFVLIESSHQDLFQISDSCLQFLVSSVQFSNALGFIAAKSFAIATTFVCHLATLQVMLGCLFCVIMVHVLLEINWLEGLLSEGGGLV